MHCVWEQVAVGCVKNALILNPAVFRKKLALQWKDMACLLRRCAEIITSPTTMVREP